MTSHGLVRCSPQRLLASAQERHAPCGPDRTERFPRWRDDDPRADRSTSWVTRLPDGSVLGWCLEVDAGANGVLAHLSAAVVGGRLTRLPGPVQRLVLRRWTEHELAVLARAVEAEAGSGRGRTATG